MQVASPWDGLVTRRVHRSLAAPTPIKNPGSKAGRVLSLLRSGSMSAIEILLDDELDIASAGQLWACMKHHINCGRVRVEDGVYSLDAEYDERLQTEVRAAVKLLKERGYTVEAPK